MIKRLSQLLILTIVACCAAACNDKDEPTTDSKVKLAIAFNLPEDAPEGTLSDVSLTFSNINTGTQSTFSDIEIDKLATTVEIDKGYYNVSLNGKLTFTYNGAETTIDASALTEGVNATGNNPATTLNIFIDKSSLPTDPSDKYNGFVLAEIFCAGSKTQQGTAYFADTYFRIYNNTDRVLYADSLAIMETWFKTTSKNLDLNPDITNDALTVMALYMIPGNGTDHPVPPGGSLLIANNAIDHSYAYPSSFDLTKADFEWYDESTNPSITDIDNPDVPNLERYYSMTLTVWDPNTQGQDAFALVKIKTDKNTYLKEYRYTYEYTVVPGVDIPPFTTTGDCYKIPNDWVVDAVNISIPGAHQWLVTPPSVDAGWTHCSNFLFDDSRLGLCVRRKVASRTTDGRAILQDTNNSTNDFEPRQKADPFHQF